MLPERFLAKVSPEPNTGCWLWTASVNHHGYGQFGVPGERRTMLAHRFAYEVLKGPIRPGLQIDHLCRVRSCVNPAHMQQVTAWTNTRRGRCMGHTWSRGERSRQAKITARQAEEIRNDQRPWHEIAAAHGIHVSTVYRVKSGRAWTPEAA